MAELGEVKIFFSEGSGAISKIIKFFGFMRHSHCGFLIGDQLTFEASWNGVVMNRWKEHYLDNPKVKYEVYKLPAEYQYGFSKSIYSTMVELMGVGYGYKQLYGFFVVWVKRVFGDSDAPNPVHDEKGSIVCSELMGYGFKTYAEGEDKIAKKFATWLKRITLLYESPDSLKPQTFWEKVEVEDLWKLDSQKGY